MRGTTSPAVPSQALALNIQQFCEAYGISRSNFYKLLSEGQAPRVVKLGRRSLISRSDAAAWFDKLPKLVPAQAR